MPFQSEGNLHVGLSYHLKIKHFLAFIIKFFLKIKLDLVGEGGELI
jgi:hypothetical protein